MIFVYLPSRYSLLFKRPITFAQCSHVPASYEARSHRRLGPVIVAINKDVASGKKRPASAVRCHLDGGCRNRPPTLDLKPPPIGWVFMVVGTFYGHQEQWHLPHFTPERDLSNLNTWPRTRICSVISGGAMPRVSPITFASFFIAFKCLLAAQRKPFAIKTRSVEH